MRTILLADDDRYVIEGMLKHIPWEELGVRVAGTAADGREALEKYKTLRPDIVMTDVYMPEMDGFELAAAIHEIDPAFPIVFLSGYDDFANARKAASSGVQHFLLKPPSLTEIVFVVREVVEALDEHRERDELLAGYMRQQHVLRQSMKDVFFRDMLSTRYRAEELPLSRIEFMGLPPSPAVQVLTISLIRSDAMNKKQERDWQLLRFGTGNIIRELLAKRLGECDGLFAEAVDYTDKDFVVLFLTEDARQPIDPDLVLSVSTEIAENVLKYMKISVLCGLGLPRAGYPGMIDSFLESQIAVETAEMNEMNRIYAYEEGADPEHGVDEAFEWIRQLNDAIYQKRLALARELWKKLREELRRVCLALSVLRGVYAGILSSAWAATSAAASSAAASEEEAGGLEELLLALHRCRTGGQATEWMDEQLTRLLCRGTEQTQGRRTHALVERVVKEYIETCYHRTITLEEIAAELHVNRNYLSQLFKKVTGEPFVTYLNKHRIEKAKEQMLTGKFMVYEISDSVGFQNPTYFSQVFKSITGRSPSEFMSQL